MKQELRSTKFGKYGGQFVPEVLMPALEELTEQYEKYKDVKLSCVGSIAFYFSDILRAVAAKKGVYIETIIETPIAALTLYHLGEK